MFILYYVKSIQASNFRACETGHRKNSNIKYLLSKQNKVYVYNLAQTLYVASRFVLDLSRKGSRVFSFKKNVSLELSVEPLDLLLFL